MLAQRRREQMKDYEKQEKRLKELKQSGMSSKQAQAKNQREALTRKQAKGKASQQAQNDGGEQQRLIAKPKEYIVKVSYSLFLSIDRRLRCCSERPRLYR